MNKQTKIYRPYNWILFNVLAYYLVIFSVPQEIIGQANLRLEDCYKIALTNRVELKNAEIDKQNANWELVREKTGFLPTVNISYSHSLSYNNRANYFPGDYSGTLSTYCNMKIFDWFSVWRQIDIAKLKLYQIKEELNYKELEILTDVAESFFSLLFTNEQLLATELQLYLTDSILQKTQQLFSIGKIMQNDVEEVILQHIQEEKIMILLQKNYDLALIALSDVLQFHYDNAMIDFEYYENYSNVEFNFDEYHAYESSVVKNYPYLKVLETEKKIFQLNDHLLRSQNRPSIILNYSLSTGYSELVIKNPEINFYDNINNSFTGLITFAVSIPVFNNRNIKTNMLINKANINKNENTYNATLSNLKADLAKQYIDAKASVERFQLAQQELKTIKKVLDNRILLYTTGKSDIFTVLDYKKQYNDIEKTYILSKYEAILKSELLKLFLLE